MKRYFLFFVLALFTALTVQAEQLNLSQAELNTGKNPFFSSFDAKMTFKSPNRILMMSFNNIRGNTRFGYHSQKANVLATCGIQENAPWFGPEVDFSWKNISTLHWFGWIFGDVGHAKWENPKFFFALNALYISVKPITLSYTIFHYFDGKPNNIPGISYRRTINQNFSWAIGADYNIRDSEGKSKPMFNIGLKYTP